MAPEAKSLIQGHPIDTTVLHHPYINKFKALVLLNSTYRIHEFR